MHVLSIVIIVDQRERNKLRLTFQASRNGDQRKMNEIQQMFINYNLFKHGHVVCSVSRKKYSIGYMQIP
jgi:hypothetical protein